MSRFVPSTSLPLSKHLTEVTKVCATAKVKTDIGKKTESLPWNSTNTISRMRTRVMKTQTMVGLFRLLTKNALKKWNIK